MQKLGGGGGGGYMRYPSSHLSASGTWADITAKVGACRLSIGPLVGILHWLSIQMIHVRYPFNYF